MASEQDLLLGLLEPLYAQASDGRAKMTSFLSEGAGSDAAKQMLSALSLVRVTADGAVALVEATEDEPMVELPKKVTNSLKTALAKQTQAASAESAATQELTPGMKCQRKNCGNEYSADDDACGDCKFCPGIPVFHEGYKYWSCCPKRKTYDFDEFLNFKGCEAIKGCQWFKDLDTPMEEKQCRYDYFQTPGDVTVSVFAKCAEPEQTIVKVNSTTIEIETVYERTCAFKLSFKLGGTVDPSASSVMFTSGKIDIKLKKAGGGQWSSLESGAA